MTNDKEKNKIVLISPQMFMYYEHMVVYLFRKYDEVILSTKYCRSTVEQLVNLFTKDLRMANETGRKIEEDDTLIVTLKIIGALR